MSDHRFRFGVVATPQDGDQWRTTAQRVAELGYATLLMPDGLQLLSPFPALAAAAATADVRVGTFVLAAPAAWEAHWCTIVMSVVPDGLPMHPRCRQLTARLA